MIALVDGALLFHGSYASIPVVDLSKCSFDKDFGQGFYLTTSYAQATLAIKKRVRVGDLQVTHTTGYISVYKYHANANLKSHVFAGANREWLQFIAYNRRHFSASSALRAYEDFDIIGGKIANDHTSRTLQIYMAGGYGPPGSLEADSVAVRTLLPNRLEDQFCFRTKAAVEALEFVRSEKYDIST